MSSTETARCRCRNPRFYVTDNTPEEGVVKAAIDRLAASIRILPATGRYAHCQHAPSSTTHPAAQRSAPPAPSSTQGSRRRAVTAGRRAVRAARGCPRSTGRLSVARRHANRSPPPGHTQRGADHAAERALGGGHRALRYSACSRTEHRPAENSPSRAPPDAFHPMSAENGPLQTSRRSPRRGRGRPPGTSHRAARFNRMRKR